MQLKILKEIIKKKIEKSEFAIITDLENSNSEIFELDKPISKNLKNIKIKSMNSIKIKKMALLRIQIYL